ncbi:SusC/RagA family TonB-linked outer membrane protein [Pedobacter punctiformis]|uniref:SusC/RagA family TonB-linked outer membrane protein n=1 Tax=Pedobacter punctiformis TaxID=3004097 RepID=A0ABT4LAC9_9SPHI|nr:SusC/RagA family TonB-linked outer membrane protein [Pedobacter sp. HCMS5-2]MCZ4244855.1 SusC/RagA family TonB-linked outer membrane protein [Pedobacter sp. HCMS5-2]
MVKIIKGIFCALLLSIFGFSVVQAKTLVGKDFKINLYNRVCKGGDLIKVKNQTLAIDTNKKQKTAKDSTLKVAGEKDTLGRNIRLNRLFKGNKDSLSVGISRAIPNLSLQQMLKGNIAGLYVQETTGEPGTEQSMIIQGTSSPIFNKRDIYNVQPVVYINGIPLVQDNPFAYDVQKYDYNRIGPATNLLSSIDIDNIASIEVIKDPVSLAKLGPNAANGAIWITTRAAKSGTREISVNSYFGMVQASNVSTVNGVFENNFRKPFYQKYATADNYANYASYLKDSTNTDYFGKSNWNDSYYKTNPTYSVDLGISGGSDRANFRFFGSGTKSAGNADATSLTRYNASFAINMAPFDWVTVSSFINASRLDRARNRSLRDRFAEVRYLPDLVNPLSPNKDNYQTFLDEYDKVVDDNRNNLVNGSLSLNFKLTPRLNFVTSLLFDYNEGIRDAFFPSTLMEKVNYVSNYFGYNQRFGLNNVLTYKYDLNKDHKFQFGLGQTTQGDTYKYNYARAYNGPNDFIKINVVSGNSNAGYDKNGNIIYLNTLAEKASGFYVFRYTDKMKNGLVSFHASAKYEYKDLLTFAGIIRRDGSSNGQPDSRWITTPAVSAEWNLKNQFLKNNNFFNSLTAGVSWGRSAKIFTDDRFGAGPQYRVEYGWNEEPTIPTFGAAMGVSRPYNTGWVGYGITLPYSDRFNFTLASSLFRGRIDAAVSLYNRDDKNQLLNLPVAAESGYASIYKNGMWINNKGADVLISAQVLTNENKLSWSSTLNFGFNKNTLKALPDNLNSLVIGDNKLTVGHSVGSYWLYSNAGIYNSDAEVPVNPANNKKLAFNGIALKAGDPKWVDYNGDYNVTDADKVMKGDRLPKLTGGWGNTFNYGNFTLNFNFFFALGQKAINQFDASRYDFANRETASDINSIKEITTWQTSDNIKTYPIYNTWSNVVPYRVDQDLFLENASYVKLRSLTFGYDLSKARFLSKSKLGFRKAYVYVTGSNLFTITNFSGTDPELINYNGTYDGTSLPIARTFTVGFKVDL